VPRDNCAKYHEDERISVSDERTTRLVATENSRVFIETLRFISLLTVATNTQPNTGGTRATGRWTADEDAKLTSAVTNTSEKKWSNEYKIILGCCCRACSGSNEHNVFR
jgi:hypothetical protein